MLNWGSKVVFLKKPLSELQGFRCGNHAELVGGTEADGGQAGFGRGCHLPSPALSHGGLNKERWVRLSN